MPTRKNRKNATALSAQIKQGGDNRDGSGVGQYDGRKNTNAGTSTDRVVTNDGPAKLIRTPT